MQPAVPAAAGIFLSDLLNLPHFNHTSVKPLSSYRSLAWIPKRPAASSESLLSAASCLELPPIQTDVAPSYKERERKKKEEKTFQSMSSFFKNTTKDDHSGDQGFNKCCCVFVLFFYSVRQETHGTRELGLKKKMHPDTVKQTVASFHRLNYKLSQLHN